MPNIHTFSAPSPTIPDRPISLRKPISAIQLLTKENGGSKLGLLMQLGSGTTVEVCGNGFNERTVMVRVNGQYYFVFLQDIEAHKALGATA